MPNLIRKYLTKESLASLYLRSNFSTYDIARLANCDNKTVYYWLKKYKIQTRPRKVIPISKIELEKLYKAKLSLKTIGERIGCTSAAVFRKFKKFSIKTRATWETNIIYKRSNFSNDLQEKAYLIGFRIGDLNVVQKTPASFIIVKTNTTKVDQVTLLRNLFSKYGPIWIGFPKNVYHFSTSLNNSFSFLKQKHSVIPKWIIKSKRLFLSFIAGYTDAEGTAGVYNNRASFRIGSYDWRILKQIHNFLINLKIKSTFNLERKAGIYGKLKHNGDFYRVSVRDKNAINKFLIMILPLLKHKNRIKCAELALKNVHSRM